MSGGSRVSLVTGAGSGIGDRIARALARRGDAVVLLDRDRSAVADLAAELPGSFAAAADVTDSAAVEAAVAAAVAAFGRIDSVVCSAGIEIGGPAHTLTASDVRRTLDVNVVGSFVVARAVAARWIAAGEAGRIVLIGSANSQVALPGQAAYAASKGAVLMLGRALAVDWGPYGITTNVVGPGVTDTPMSAASLADPAKRAAMMARIPLGVPGQPEQVAAAVAFLTGDDAAYVNGAFLAVDGGWLARG